MLSSNTLRSLRRVFRGRPDHSPIGNRYNLIVLAAASSELSESLTSTALETIRRVHHRFEEQLRHFVREFRQKGGFGKFDQVPSILAYLYHVKSHVVDGAVFLPRVEFHHRTHAQRRGLHAHAKAADSLAVPERCRTTKGCRNLQNRRGHA